MDITLNFTKILEQAGLCVVLVVAPAIAGPQSNVQSEWWRFLKVFRNCDADQWEADQREADQREADQSDLGHSLIEGD
jgi:hypothetical protein